MAVTRRNLKILFLSKKIDHSDHSRNSKIDGVEQSLGSLIDKVEQGLNSKIDYVEQSLGSKIDQVIFEMRAGFGRMSAEIHQGKAIVEEQENRNKFVLDGYVGLHAKQEELETRVIALEKRAAGE